VFGHMLVAYKLTSAPKHSVFATFAICIVDCARELSSIASAP
jgi:hypothetical protein